MVIWQYVVYFLNQVHRLFSRDNEGRNVLFYAIAGQAYNVAKYLIETALTEFR